MTKKAPKERIPKPPGKGGCYVVDAKGKVVPETKAKPATKPKPKAKTKQPPTPQPTGVDNG